MSPLRESTTRKAFVPVRLTTALAMLAAIAGCTPDASDSRGGWLPGAQSGLSPSLEVSPTSLDFGADTGEMSLRIRSSSGAELVCTIQSRTAWVLHNVASATVGADPVDILVSVDRSALSDGEHSTVLLVKPGSGDVIEVPITAIVSGSPPADGDASNPDGASPDGGAGWDTSVDPGGGGSEPSLGQLALSTDTLEFGDDIETLSFTLRYVGEGDVGFTVTPTDDWITVDPASGMVGPGGVPIEVSVLRDKMAYGDWSTMIEVQADGGLEGGVQADASVSESPWPAFAISRSDGTFRTYSGAAVYYDELVYAQLIDQGDDVWDLRLMPRVGGIRQVWFPWQPNRYALGGNDSDDVIYYPRRIGVAYDSASLPDDEWQGQGYPGQCFSPLVTIADGQESRTIAAMNWPPLGLTSVLYSRGKATLAYWGYLDYGVSYDFLALCCRTLGDEAAGDAPWYTALDKYRQWLNEHMESEGLYPIAYPQAMLDAHGWMQVKLHYDAEFDVGDMYALYDAYSSDLPWVQFWGQMSNYQYSPGDGLYETPVPPLEPGEEVGCCLCEHAMHPRYLPDLPQFAQAVTGSGGYVSYYSRPTEPYQYLDGSNPDYTNDFLDWLAQNEANGANAHYFDVVGGGNFGDPLGVAQAFVNQFPPMTVIEFPVDVYPTAFLISGALYGGRDWAIEPGHTIDDLNPTFDKITFPRFGRYLLDDRIVFLGGANDDIYWWGESSGYHSYTERQAFLLGAKFDAPTQRNTTPEWPGYCSPITTAVRLTIDERNRVGWWTREPRYRDRRGVSSVPDNVDVAVFVDHDDAVLFCIDNWFETTGKSFLYNGQPVVVPAAKLSIVEYNP